MIRRSKSMAAESTRLKASTVSRTLCILVFWGVITAFFMLLSYEPTAEILKSRYRLYTRRPTQQSEIATPTREDISQDSERKQAGDVASEASTSTTMESPPSSRLLPYTIQCDSFGEGKVWTNCEGNYRDYVRKMLGDECMDIKVRPLILPEWCEYGGGPGKSLSAILSMLKEFDVATIYERGMNETEIHQSMLEDRTRYNVVWAPIWHAIDTKWFDGFLSNRIPVSASSDAPLMTSEGVYTVEGKEVLIVGPNVRLPGEYLHEYWPENTALVFPSWWGAAFHSFKADKEKWYYSKPDRVKGIPTAINTFYYDPQTFCEKFEDLYVDDAGRSTITSMENDPLRGTTGKRYRRPAAPPVLSDATCYLYTKMGSPTQLRIRAAAKRALTELGAKCETLDYGRYSEEDFRKVGCRSHFVVISDLTETQGYAFQELLALGVPLFVLGSGVGMERSYLTASYFDDKCGMTWEPPFPLDHTGPEWTYEYMDEVSKMEGGPDRFLVDHMKQELGEFYGKVLSAHFNPRPYIVEHLGIVPTFLQWWAQFCRWANVPVKEKIEQVKTMWEIA